MSVFCFCFDVFEKLGCWLDLGSALFFKSFSKFRNL